MEIAPEKPTLKTSEKASKWVLCSVGKPFLLETSYTAGKLAVGTQCSTTKSKTSQKDIKLDLDALRRGLRTFYLRIFTAAITTSWTSVSLNIAENTKAPSTKIESPIKK